jgi:hypothetical protein
MKPILAFLIVFLFLGNTTFSQDDAMKAWMEYMTPGKVHENLAKGVGEWKSIIKFWMAPGTEPQISEGSAVSEMILGGRYLQSKHSGTSFACFQYWDTLRNFEEQSCIIQLVSHPFLIILI